MHDFFLHKAQETHCLIFSQELEEKNHYLVAKEKCKNLQFQKEQQTEAHIWLINHPYLHT